MAQIANGIHVPNSRHWDVEQTLRVSGTNGAVTILHDMMFPRDEVSAQYGDVENAYRCWKLRNGWPAQGIPAAPERFVHVRLFQHNWRDCEAAAIARQAVELLTNCRFGGLAADLWQGPIVGVSPCNEQNLEPVGNKEYALHARWQLDFRAEMDRLLPNRKALSGLSAWAYGGDVQPDGPDSDYQLPSVRDVLAHVDVLASHPCAHYEWGLEAGRATVDPARDGYWRLLRDFRPEGWLDNGQTGRPHDIGGLLAQVQGKPLLTSEAGTFRHSDRALTQETLWAMRTLLGMAGKYGRVLRVTGFIWNSGQGHGGNRIWASPDLRAGMEALPDYATTCKVPLRGATPVPLPEAVVTGGEVHERIVKRDGYTAVARRLLGREPTMPEVAELSAYNGNAKLVPGACVRSPWHKAVRK